VTADVRIERENAAADDAFDVTLHYSNGMRGGSSIQHPRRRSRHGSFLLGTQGSFVKQTFDPQEMNLRRGYIPVDKRDRAEENWGVLTVPSGDSFGSGRVPSAHL